MDDMLVVRVRGKKECFVYDITRKISRGRGVTYVDVVEGMPADDMNPMLEGEEDDGKAGGGKKPEKK